MSDPVPPSPARDARRQSPAVQAERRSEVIRLHLEGLSRAQIAKQTGLSWATVDRSVRLYAEGGNEALVAAPRGRRPGTGAALAADQEAAIRQMMRKPPRQHHVGAWLWTRPAVGQLIAKTFGISLSDRALAGYLDAWGVRPENLERRPELRGSPVVRAWVDANYSDTRARARREHIDIFWLHVPRRLDPTVWNRSPPKSHWLVSASTMQGKLYFKIVEGAFKPTAQSTFIKALLRESPRATLYAIRDNDATYNSGALRVALSGASVTLYRILRVKGNGRGARVMGRLKAGERDAFSR